MRYSHHPYLKDHYSSCSRYNRLKFCTVLVNRYAHFVLKLHWNISQIYNFRALICHVIYRTYHVVHTYSTSYFSLPNRHLRSRWRGSWRRRGSAWSRCRSRRGRAWSEQRRSGETRCGYVLGTLRPQRWRSGWIFRRRCAAPAVGADFSALNKRSYVE